MYKIFLTGFYNHDFWGWNHTIGDSMDKKVVLTAAIVVAFLLSSSILVLFYNQDSEDREITLVARVNTEGSGIYIDAKYTASDFIVVGSDGNPQLDADGDIQYIIENWRGKVFGTSGTTAIQHIQLMNIVLGMGLNFVPYSDGVDTSSNSNNVYYVSSITNAAAFENSSNSYIDGGIIWQPQYQALLESTTRPCNSLMSSDQFDPGHTCCVIGASHSYINANEDATVRFLAAYVESVNWVNDAISNPGSENYNHLVQLAMDRTGITDRDVIVESLTSVTYTYGNTSDVDSEDAPLVSLETSIESLVTSLYETNQLGRTMAQLGFSSIHEFAQRYVNDGYLAQALDFEYSEDASYTATSVTVAIISGDIHQIAIHLGIDQGIFEKYGISVNLLAAANGAGVATSLQNGSAQFGFVGAPPMTITTINGMLSTS